MKKALPRFVVVHNSDDLDNDLVLETEHPYLLGMPYGVPRREPERVEEMLQDIANGRTGTVKVPGYTVFMSPYGTLSGERMEPGRAEDTLRDMGEFYARQVLERNGRKRRLFREE